jgi:hypothetical protein
VHGGGPTEHFTRTEGVPGSSPGVGFLPICREEVSSLTSLAGGQLEHIPANARSKPFEGNTLFCRVFSYPLVCRDFCGLLKFSSQVAPHVSRYEGAHECGCLLGSRLRGWPPPLTTTSGAKVGAAATASDSPF